MPLAGICGRTAALPPTIDDMSSENCLWCFKELKQDRKYCSSKCCSNFNKQMNRFGAGDHSVLPVCVCGNLACPDPWKTNGRRQMGKHRRCLDCRKAQRARADAGRGSYKAKRRREIVKAGEKIAFDDLLMRDGPLCQICGELMDWQTGRHRERVSLDHIIPISKGGSHTMDNVRLVHMGCNSKKSDRLPADVLCRDQ
jgi:5-methylcytosine-specific restriction endonuclease McrA